MHFRNIFISTGLSFLVIFAFAHPGGAQLLNDNRFAPDRVLQVTHGAIDPLSNDLLLVSNSWRGYEQRLRRFHSDGSAVGDFSLQRFEFCCAIEPSLVAVDFEGSIYTLEYTPGIVSFNIYKHSSTGELVIDWGRGRYVSEYSSLGSGTENEGYEEGESALYRIPEGGKIECRFEDPIDMIPVADGSLLVLDRILRIVYRISPDGSEITEFIGKQGYYPNSPQRLIQDSEGFLYLVDYYDYDDFSRSGLLGVQKFSPDGEWIMGWGEGSNSINDPWRENLDLSTLVIDGLGNMIALGGEKISNHNTLVYLFDTSTGGQITRGNIQYRAGTEEEYLGTLPDPEGGFILLEGRDFDINVKFYSPNGVLDHQVRIDNLYFAD